MAKREQLELDAHRAPLARKAEAALAGPCRAIFGRGVPDTSEPAADGFIFEPVRHKPDPTEKGLEGASVPWRT